MGKAKEFDSGAEIVFNLQNDKYMCLLGALKSFQLPQIKSFTFNNVPEDSELVKSFIENNIPIQSQFEFNKEKQVEIKGSKYLNAFKSAADKTLDVFSINNTILSANELCEIISTAKYCKKLQFCFDFIEFDEELDFIENMEGCKIEYLSFNSSGSSYYSDWNQNPKRFVNIVVAISRCIPLSVSLKIINITNCGITEEDAVKILRNLHLNSIKIII